MHSHREMRTRRACDVSETGMLIMDFPQGNDGVAGGGDAVASRESVGCAVECLNHPHVKLRAMALDDVSSWGSRPCFLHARGPPRYRVGQRLVAEVSMHRVRPRVTAMSHYPSLRRPRGYVRQFYEAIDWLGF